MTPQLFQNDAGEPLKFFDAVVGGRSVGTPGTPALLETVHQRWGALDWGDLLAPAAAMAETGFTVSPRLASLVAADAERLGSSPTAAAYFLPNGAAIQAGVLQGDVKDWIVDVERRKYFFHRFLHH